MSLLDEAIAGLHAINARLRDEEHAVAGELDVILEKLGIGLAEAGTVVTDVAPGAEAAVPAAAPLVQDVATVVKVAEAGDEAAQAAVDKIKEATAPVVEAAKAQPAPSEQPTPATPPTGDGSAAASPGETGAVQPNETTPVSGEQ